MRPTPGVSRSHSGRVKHSTGNSTIPHAATGHLSPTLLSKISLPTLCRHLNLCTNRRSRSCGTLTSAPVLALGSGKVDIPYCGKQPLTDTPNYCNTTPYQVNGHADGVVTFVFTDCTTNKVLPMSYQDPAYAQPGVSTGPMMS